MKNKDWLRGTKKDYDKKYIIELYHIMIAYRMPIKLKSKKSKHIKYRFKSLPFERVLTPNVITRLDTVDTSKMNNSEWYNKFINRCKMNYVFL